MIVNSKKNMNTAETAESLRFTDVRICRVCVLVRLTPKPRPFSLGKQRKDKENQQKKRKEKSVCVCVINGYVAVGLSFNRNTILY